MCQKISIIVPIYNVEKYINKTINSLLNQTYNNIEIILVDDGSTDRSGMICDFYKNNPKVVVLHKNNGGLSDARNKGIEKATGEYIGFVDGDDYVESEMYGSLMNAIEVSGADIACCGMIREDEDITRNTKLYCPETIKLYSDQEAINEILLMRDIDVSVCNKLYKSDIFASLRFPVGKTNEDAAIVLDTICDRKVIHVGKAYYHYIIRSGSITAVYNIKTMNCTYQNSVNIYDKICRKYPDLQVSAAYYLSYNLITIICAYLSTKDIKDVNQKMYIKRLRNLTSSIMLNPYHNRKNKIIAILSYFHILPLVYCIKNMRRRSSGN